MGFTVTTLPAQHRFDVVPGEDILTAALRQGIHLPYVCREGACGSCAAHLVSGQVQYPNGLPAALQDQPETRCLTCQAVPESDLVLQVDEVQGPREIQPQILPCRVVHKERLNHDVMLLKLKLPDQQRLEFFAGQYLDFLLQDGRRRAFSIANAPQDNAFIELHIRHVPGGSFTDYVFNQLEEKAVLRIQAPLGGFMLRENPDRPLLFVAGGTGFAPIKAMLEDAFHRGVSQPMTLYWGVRSRRDLYLPDLPERWAETHANFRYIPVLSEPDEDWTGRTGWVHEAVLQDHPDLSGFDLYISGPPILVEKGRQAFEQAGLPRAQLFSDAFEYAADAKQSP